MKRITEARATAHYRLFVKFDDGASGEVDLSDLVGNGVFAAWQDPSVFAKVTIDGTTGTVSWPGGIDLCPEKLYHDITGSPLPGTSKIPA